MSIIEITFDPRAAMEIHRYHTWRRIREQSNGEHTAQVMRIMLNVWPEVPRKLLVYAVSHDMGEMAGDIPYPFKAKNPALGEQHKRVEAGVISQMCDDWDYPRPPVLSLDEENFFKACEYIEMWEWGLTEQNMGNQYGKLVAERCILQASNRYLKLSPEIQDRFKKYTRKRMEQENVF